MAVATFSHDGLVFMPSSICLGGSYSGYSAFTNFAKTRESFRCKVVSCARRNNGVFELYEPVDTIVVYLNFHVAALAEQRQPYCLSNEIASPGLTHLSPHLENVFLMK